MVRYCKGLCNREEWVMIIVGKDIYREGVKRCRLCEKYMRLDSIRCPCCSSMMKTKSRRYRVKKMETASSRLLLPLTS
jgi:hypothetical protein